MQKILITVAVATLLPACSMTPLDSVVHKIEIKQGNIIDQATLDQLRPGMEKRQVRFIMGTPMIVDTFNQERWEYIYRLHRSGGEPTENTHVSLFFDHDKLARIEGDMRPQPIDESAVKKSEIVEVPLKDPEEKGLVKRVVDTVTFDALSKSEDSK